ncbi:MAG: hypothetical protein IBX68_10220, partial [Dehalococcoidia bacterium]|nr:hypothetical protein [Dehalococcoidia bacterium]
MGNMRNNKLVFVQAAVLALLLCAGLFAACDSAGVATPSPVPGNETAPDYYWRTDATEEQLQTIELLWGQELTVGEFFQAVWPEVARELPAPVLHPEINWPGESVNWDVPLVGGLAVAIIEGDSDPEGYQLYYYVGPYPDPSTSGESAEIPPPSTPRWAQPCEQTRYFIHIYTTR